MSFDWRMSTYLKEHLEELDEGVAGERGEDKDEGLRDASLLAAELLAPHLAFAGKAINRNWVSLKKATPDAVEMFLDECYTRQLLSLIPQLVRRTMKLGIIIADEITPAAANVFLHEASRAYVFGFWQACIALARAAVEEALREQFKAKFGTQTNASLDQLAETCTRSRILDKAHADLAGRVRESGNRVLHGKPSNEKQAWASLTAARGVLAYLFEASIE
jgi:hypothetical protein